MNWYGLLIYLICIIVGYLFGAIPTGVIISTQFYNIDVRDYGSHGSGGTNSGRVMGKKIGVLVIALDAIKVIIPFIAAFLVLTKTNLGTYTFCKMPEITYYSVALAAVIGHCYPVYIGFKGGKAVSCMVGTIVSTSYIGFGVGAISFFTTLKLSKHVSLASMIAALFVAATSYLVFIPAVAPYVVWPGMAANFTYPILMTAEFVILVIRHRSNIKRLAKNEESSITWM